MNEPIELFRDGKRLRMAVDEHQLRATATNSPSYANRTIRVHRVIFRGLRRTSDTVANHASSNFVNCYTFGELLCEIGRFRDHLMHSECFKDIGIRLDTAGEDHDAIQVTVDVKEKNLLSGTGELTAGNVNNTAQVGLNLWNLDGRGLSANLAYGHTTQATSTVSMLMKRPFISTGSGHAPTMFSDWSAHVLKTTDKCPISKWQHDILAAAILKLRFGRRNSCVQHALSWTGEMRELRALDATAPFVVRQLAAATLKSAVAHELTADTRTQTIFPRAGHFFNMWNEVAGFGGNVAFFKHETRSQFNYFLNPFIFQFDYNFGFLSPLKPKYESITPIDQFFVGGPSLFRGFQAKGLAGREIGANIGSNMYYVLSSRMLSPLPFQPSRMKFSDSFKLQLFSTIGSVANDDLTKDPKSALNSLLESSRASVGVGLAFKFASVLQLELNYCWPLRVRAHDRPKPGFQFAFSFSNASEDRTRL